MFKVKNASPTYHDTSTADAQSAAADGGYHFATIGNTLRHRDRVTDSQRLRLKRLPEQRLDHTSSAGCRVGHGLAAHSRRDPRCIFKQS